MPPNPLKAVAQNHLAEAAKIYEALAELSEEEAGSPEGVRLRQNAERHMELANEFNRAAHREWVHSRLFNAWVRQQSGKVYKLTLELDTAGMERALAFRAGRDDVASVIKFRQGAYRTTFAATSEETLSLVKMFVEE